MNFITVVTAVSQISDVGISVMSDIFSKTQLVKILRHQSCSVMYVSSLSLQNFLVRKGIGGRGIIIPLKNRMIFVHCFDVSSAELGNQFM